MINLSSCGNGGIQEIFSLFRNFLNINQYGFGLVTGSNSFPNSFVDKRAITKRLFAKRLSQENSLITFLIFQCLLFNNAKLPIQMEVDNKL